MNKNRLAAVGVSALIIMWAIHFAANHIQEYGSIKGHTEAVTQGPSALVRSLRPAYPYSVIAGGAYSPAEFQFAHNKDGVVRAHYAGFNVSLAKFVTLTDDRYQYASYRVKDQIYWTKKKLRIPKGELLITDGENYARARCGNRLSDQPHQSQTSLHEPDPALLSLPPINSQMLSKLELVKAPSALADVPAGTPALPAYTGAVVPAESASVAYSAQPIVPLEAVWGGQPVLGGGLIGGSPLIPTTSNPVNATPTTPSNPVTASNPTPPGTPPGVTPPPDVLPVPEPHSIYLFLVSLGVSLWALLRMSPKDEAEK